MLWYEWHTFVLVADLFDSLVGLYAVVVLLEDSVSIAVTCAPVEVTAECASTQAQFHTATVTLAGVHHHTTETVVTRHYRQLLVADKHVVTREVEVKTVVKEVEVGAELIVPTLLRFVGDGVADVVISLLVVLHDDIHVLTG